MAIIIGFQSAFEYWKLPSSRGVAARSRPRLSTLEALASTKVEVGEFVERSPLAALLSRPLHIVVPSRSTRVDLPGIVCHVREGALPPEALCQISPGLFVVSPEMCFVELATTMRGVPLLETGYELCGIFARDLKRPDELPRVREVAKASRLREFATSVGAWSGNLRAEKAAEHILDRVASPFEGKIAIALTLPRNGGGLNLGAPNANYAIPVPSNIRHLVNQDAYECDFYWPEYRIALEYDSDLKHLTHKSLAHDSEKRNALSLMGITTVTLTNGQLAHPNLLEGVATNIRRLMGVRERIQTRDFEAKRTLLRIALFGKDTWDPTTFED